jgi:hypothetical protein
MSDQQLSFQASLCVGSLWLLVRLAKWQLLLIGEFVETFAELCVCYTIKYLID